MTYTAAFRLAGPTQSWGTPSYFDHKDTLPYPTLSGVLGLMRAAYGIPRTAPISEWEWMLNLGIAVRIDQPGHIRTDYHTINPRKAVLANGEPFADHENTAQLPLGSGKPWKIGNAESTKVTTRDHLHDAVFTLFLTGTQAQTEELLTTIDNPTWALSLGRKSCVPAFPLALGITPGGPMYAASTVPAYRNAHTDTTEETADLTIHVLHDPTGLITGTLPAITHNDRPTGSHPLHPRLPLTRHVLAVTAPTTTDTGILTWRNQHHPLTTP